METSSTKTVFFIFESGFLPSWVVWVPTFCSTESTGAFSSWLPGTVLHSFSQSQSFLTSDFRACCSTFPVPAPFHRVSHHRAIIQFVLYLWMGIWWSFPRFKILGYKSLSAWHQLELNLFLHHQLVCFPFLSHVSMPGWEYFGSSSLSNVTSDHGHSTNVSHTCLPWGDHIDLVNTLKWTGCLSFSKLGGCTPRPWITSRILGSHLGH